MDCKDDDVRDFPLSAYCCIPLQVPLANVIQPKAHVSGEGYHMSITTSIPVNKMAVRLEGPNITTEWLVLLLRIWEVLGSHLAPGTGYPDWIFLVFLSPSRQTPE
jgi:hypothetical protein